MYNSDLRKLYDLKDPEWRYDIMPEIIDGKNVRRPGCWLLCLLCLVHSRSRP